MTKEEALLFFQLDGDEYPEDQWELTLFEYKQFFLTRPVIAKVFKAKLNKLQKQFQAYLVLTELPYNQQKEESSNFPTLVLSEKVLVTFQALFTFRSAIKQLLLQTNDVDRLVKLILHWLKEEQNYQNFWLVDFQEIELKNITVAKEKDPMLLLSTIQKWDNGEGKDFKTLKQSLNDLPETLLDEVKRLSLLLKFNV